MLQYVGETVRQHIEGRGEGQATDPTPTWDLQVSDQHLIHVYIYKCRYQYMYMTVLLNIVSV